MLSQVQNTFGEAWTASLKRTFSQHYQFMYGINFIWFDKLDATLNLCGMQILVQS